MGKDEGVSPWNLRPLRRVQLRRSDRWVSSLEEVLAPLWGSVLTRLLSSHGLRRGL